MFNVESVALNKSKSLKGNDENIMEIDDGIPSPHGSQNEGMCFLYDSLNKNIPCKK